MMSLLARFSLAVVLVSALPATVRAVEFEPVDGAEVQVQSRTYAAEDPAILLRASVAILQDLRYLVIRSSTAPGLLVAKTPFSGCFCDESLTISLQPDDLRPGHYRVRLTLSHVEPGGFLEIGPLPVPVDFYQDFFTHLDRELFREETR